MTMKKADPAGTIIGAATLPILFLFIYFGKPEMGFTTSIVLAVSMVAIYLQWKWRRHLWFWAAIALVLLLHIPLLFVVRWPETSVPTIAYAMPFGIVDGLLVTGAIRLAHRLFAKDSSSD